MRSTVAGDPGFETGTTLETAHVGNGSKWKAAARQIQGGVTDQAQRKPYAALAVAASLGFLVGLILKRRA